MLIRRNTELVARSLPPVCLPWKWPSVSRTGGYIFKHHPHLHTHQRISLHLYWYQIVYLIPYGIPALDSDLKSDYCIMWGGLTLTLSSNCFPSRCWKKAHKAGFFQTSWRSHRHRNHCNCHRSPRKKNRDVNIQRVIHMHIVHLSGESNLELIPVATAIATFTRRDGIYLPFW